jgi:enoyl-CoA hydratase
MTSDVAQSTDVAPSQPGSDEVDGSTLAAVRLERPAPHVLEIVLTGPGKGNAMGPDVWRELPLMMRLADRDPEVRAVLIRGSGAHFTYGLDLGSMLGDIGRASTDDGGLAGARTSLLQLIGRLQDAVTSVERCTKPVVAAIDGWCIGAGVDLISACDIRVCSASARFSVREVKVGIVADVGSLQRLPYIIGDGMTRRLALTGEDIDAGKAERIGLVSDVLPDGPETLEFARALCTQLAANPPLVVQGTKQVLNETRDLSVAEGLRHVALWNSAFLPSHDLNEAVRAFMERREPKFEGR